MKMLFVSVDFQAETEKEKKILEPSIALDFSYSYINYAMVVCFS